MAAPGRKALSVHSCSIATQTPDPRQRLTRDGFAEGHGRIKPWSVNAASWFRIGEVVADLDGPVQAIREATPQAQRAFTRFDQVTPNYVS